MPMYMISRRSEDGEIEVASADNAESAERLVQGFKKLWPAEYSIKQSESVDQNPTTPLQDP